VHVGLFLTRRDPPHETPRRAQCGRHTQALNAGIQRLKYRACGYRNRRSFRTAILFHFGGLDMQPVGAFATHTN